MYYHKADHWSHNGNLPRDVTFVDTETLASVEKNTISSLNRESTGEILKRKGSI
ncbi:hypothetical protein [Salicibibacter kimchii]|uniref:hypothetical protein n=1 Tax=Salicibibacter kimchii TaxID=2099786 RepID=UPI00135A813E|nr:hypothetical protein [Salicibibacter kimchii]